MNDARQCGCFCTVVRTRQYGNILFELFSRLPQLAAFCSPEPCFFQKIYPQKQLCGVSGKLSSTPKQYKVAHLLRFFGKPLCQLRFQTQCVTYCKSTLVCYNISGILFQAAIHTRCDANCRQKQAIFTKNRFDIIYNG